MKYLSIVEKNGTKKQVKEILRYHDDKSQNNYLIYQDKENYYACKYEDKLGLVQIDTNISEEEIKLLENILDEVRNENIG